MTILRAVLIALTAFAAACPLLSAQAPTGSIIPSMTIREGRLSFDARATAGNFTGATSSVTGEMTGGRLSEVRGWVEAPVRTLSTGNKRRDRDLNKSMESEKYPVIRFELTHVAPRDSGVDSMTVVLHGRFIIHGVTREVAIPAAAIIASESIRVRGETPLNLKDYKIGGLSKAMGMLKMHEKIVVHVDVTFGGNAGRREGGKAARRYGGVLRIRQSERSGRSLNTNILGSAAAPSYRRTAWPPL